MTNDQKDPLFVLVKSLSKSEKRQFKVYVGRLGVNTDSKFLALFNHLDKHDTLDEDLIVSKGIVKKQQFSNLKAHLYKQILISLRLSPLHQNTRSQIREQLDFASILYHKGLYKQSLKVLDKAKTLAMENEEHNIAYEIVEFEKIIETQYITRSINSRADELTVEAKMLSMKNVLTSRLSNLSLQLYGLMLKSGYVRNDKEHQEITNYFNGKLPKYEWNMLGFREKLWLYKAHLWYSFIVQDFLSCYKYSKKWLDLFYEHPKMIVQNPVFFLRGNHYLLESLYLIKDKTQLRSTLQEFENRITDLTFPKDDNIEVLSFQFIYNNKLNVHFLEGSFDEGEYLVEEILSGISEFKNRLDDHHIMVLYYKIGCLYFGMANHRKCIEYLSKIINNKSLKMREDLMCFSRVLSLVAHYEAGMDYHLETQLKETYRFLIKMNDLHEVQKEMIKFLKNLGDIYPHQIKEEFRKLHKRLKQYEDHPYEKRAFLYLDILSWLESNIEGRPVADIIKEKAKGLIR
ncbi:hypothetical protein IWQ47_004934 [Aquimarina sp. EL_43]|uniref:hypothetical protein n=1 Tax=Aquimarina TaxID=290174 RepID=UPI0004711F7A|nr:MULTISPECIES: hypothetical protein [Aquimarina]MBG6133522.1 hypothetical protein [Aquimarina sp. EL_35]MBG6153685.1 hypothetical protein [Aquimarina sp. EL_32]MBG6171836.1 hypothetical protein [Aquimarina sp. EL_43]